MAEEQKRIATQTFQQSVLKILRGMERKKEDAIMMKRVHENQVSIFRFQSEGKMT